MGHPRLLYGHRVVHSPTPGGGSHPIYESPPLSRLPVPSSRLRRYGRRLLRVRGTVLGDGSRPPFRPNSNHKDKSKSRANTRLHPTLAGIDSPRGSKCSAMKFAFADTRSRYTEVTAATARVLIQTSRNPTTFCANAKHSRREKPLTPVSHG